MLVLDCSLKTYTSKEHRIKQHMTSSGLVASSSCACLDRKALFHGMTFGKRLTNIRHLFFLSESVAGSLESRNQSLQR